MEAAGVTHITHGNGGTPTGWISGMANALSARLGGNVPIYRLSVGNGLAASVAKVSGGNPLTTTNGEIILMLDWGQFPAAAQPPIKSQASLPHCSGRRI